MLSLLLLCLILAEHVTTSKVLIKLCMKDASLCVCVCVCVRETNSWTLLLQGFPNQLANGYNWEDVSDKFQALVAIFCKYL